MAVKEKEIKTHHGNSFRQGVMFSTRPPAKPVSPFLPKTPGQLFNLFRIFSGLSLSLMTKKPFVWGRPTIIHIEPTSLCNLRCPLCPSGTGQLTRQRSRMNFEQFREVLDKLPETVRMLLLWNQGEPFIVRDFVKMIEYAKQRKLYLVTSTNGQFLDDEHMVQSLVRSRLDEIIVSLDGADQPTYEKYRIGGKLNKVFEGVEKISRYKRLSNSSQPLIHLQFILMRDNLHQQEEIIERGRKLGADKISFKTLQLGDFDDAECFLPDDPSLTRYRGKDQKNHYITRKRPFFPDQCVRLWYSMVINCDGKVSPCCFDKDGHYTLGNILEGTFDSIWFGKNYNHFRRRLLNSRYALEICRDCTEGLKNLFVRTVNYHA